MRYPIDDTFKKQLADASRRLDNNLILQKPAMSPRPPEKYQVPVSTQDLFNIRKNN